MAKTKKCTKCGKRKPLTSFHNSVANNDGFQYWCKDCHSICKKANHRQNKDRDNARSRSYYQENIESRKAHDKAYYKQNKDRICARNKAYWAANKEKISARRKIKREQNAS